MNAPDHRDLGWAADVELDLLLLSAKAGTLHTLDTTLDIATGLASIQAQHERGTASRPPPARAGPGSRREASHHDEALSDNESCHDTEGKIP